MAESKITPRAEDYAQWYQDVIAQADLAEAAGVVKGCMVIKPHGYAVWEMKAPSPRLGRGTSPIRPSSRQILNKTRKL